MPTGRPVFKAGQEGHQCGGPVPYDGHRHRVEPEIHRVARIIDRPGVTYTIDTLRDDPFT